MKPGIFGQQLSLMEQLKAGTFAAHARLQGAPFFAALAACELPLESYVGQLRALALIHGVLEASLADCGDARVASVWHTGLAKMHLLQTDLRYFEPRSVADLSEAVTAAMQADAQIRLWSLEQPRALLGCLYVLEGSTLGAAVIRPMVARALLLHGDEGMAYLTNYGTAAREHWSEFAQRMNALELGSSEREQMIDAAGQFFHLLENVFRALYPFAPESKTFLVTSINPEAGRHAIPADPREVQAALHAGDLCWQRFPYFEQRYGERGLRFARSDAAWQATLYQYEPAQILQQVRWLGRVLAARGMPTCLLQVQLELLVEALAAAVPEKKTEYEKLLAGAAALQATRRKHLSDEQLRGLDAAFDQAVGPQWSARLPGIGSLMGCAVADELEGSVQAVSSLRGWLCQAERFPETWTRAVDSVLAQARGQAHATEGAK